VLCTYNGERFLEAQINSLLQQTYPNIEIVVSDDHSTDATKDILQQYATDTRFKITWQRKNLGAIHNFEYATGQATGEFIAFCDQDDIWLPEKIEKLYRAIGNHWLAYSDSILIDEEGQSLQRNLSELRKMYSGNDTRGFVFSNVVWGHAMMVKKDLLSHVLPIPEKIPHDIWFAAKATALGGIQWLNEPLTLYRQHSKTYTTTIAQKAGTRPHEQRYTDFEEKLNWINVLKHHCREDEKSFYDKLYDLYVLKANGKFVWPLFFFLLQNQDLLFQFTNKSPLSRIIEIRKLSRGEYNS
jgi:glycosyltransferase involved in cell wall biosynthesis